MIGGALALDFVNTVGGRDGSSGARNLGEYRYSVERERLVDYEGLLEWAATAGILIPAKRRRLAEAAKGKGARVYDRAVALREALFRLFKAAIEGWQPAKRDLETLNDELAEARAQQRIEYANGVFSLSSPLDEEIDFPLRVIVLSAAELLTSDDLSRVRQCGGENCGWLFLDTSRNRSRQWCDMRDCGNLAKVRRFRARTQ